MNDAPALTRDAFLGGRLQLWQPARGFRAGSDAVLVAAACPAVAGQSVLDLGCGVGAAMYCLAARIPGLSLTGVERDGATADLARRNGPADVVTGDIFDSLPTLKRSFDHVICNPPYFPAGAGSAAQDTSRETALRETEAGAVSLWAQAACRRVTMKGSVTFILRADRLADVLTPMAERLGGLIVLPIAGRAGTPANRVILQGRKGARAPLRLLPPFVLHEGAAHTGDRDSHTDAAQAVLRHAEALPLS
ncbi:tRNA1(Val) (adenine(37)-N6)-methyltransferase [Jannaschia pohangensis]|uniref:tRNA1(Val) A37 N6-methylase TrmN6 n=1 Tax=Jannaschia pohangensis TaxID=390807 RepID=A0A1I3MT89_9RHOB|nr:methyltransferase [Jannaschia pohangensis]SFJ00010.1 tRNA1(Val) A37 N6-methylase TrmN6 [Jannaschia pohangensis]